MLHSTEIHSAARIIGEKKTIELVARAGFDAWDFSMFVMAKEEYADHPLNRANALSYARKLRKIGEDCGIHCNQSHAPFPTVDKKVADSLKKAIECTAEAGGKICIIHPGNNKSAEENAEFYSNLLPFAKGCGVKIAAENMFNRKSGSREIIPAACSSPGDFSKLLSLINDDSFVACLDIGHAELSGTKTSAPEMIRALGNRLQALHIHDNDKTDDNHQIPFSQKIDFHAVAKALKSAGYAGYLTLEANKYFQNSTPDSVFSGMLALKESVTKLDRMIADATV